MPAGPRAISDSGSCLRREDPRDRSRPRLLAGTSDKQSGSPVGASTCRVRSITDGDTFRCTNGVRVRLLLIDTPERNQVPHGAAAARALESLLSHGDEVTFALLRENSLMALRGGETLPGQSVDVGRKCLSNVHVLRGMFRHNAKVCIRRGVGDCVADTTQTSEHVRLVSG